MPDITHWTAFLYLFPHRFTEEDCDWSDFRIKQFNDRFEWRADGWNGLRDVVKKPRRTYFDGRGDCEDYAVAVASALLSETDRPVKLAFLFGHGSGHVVCYTDGEEDIIYSSGTRNFMSLSRYCTERNWSVKLTRTLRS